MNKYNRLLLRIASELNIQCGKTETEDNYKSRLIYSAVSRIGYSSLWDKLEDDISVSIEHFRRRIVNTLKSYLKMYPEVQGLFPDDYEIISETMYNVYLATGNVYHSPKRISPPIRRMASFDGIGFIRGTSLSENIRVSGIGTYTKFSIDSNSDSVQEMFGLCKQSIIDYWRHYSEQANWKILNPDGEFEFLKTTPSFLQGYWKEKPDKDGNISLMRTSIPGTKIYYLYRVRNNIIEGCQLPYWLTEEKRYLYLSNGCLASKEVLPAITYRIDGVISYLQIGYLLPPAEQNMIMLYSWPIIFSNVESPFSRVIDTEILKVIIKLLTQTGFVFKEE